MKEIILLGATGSIGTQALEIIKRHKEYQVRSISCGYNIPLVKEIIKSFNIEYVSVIKEEDAEALKKEFPSLEVGYGEEGLLNAVSNYPGDVINAITGISGLKPTVKAISLKKNVFLANKETLVVAGDIINEMAKNNGVKIIPIDSEHNAIYRLLNNEKRRSVKNLIITASGGAFRDKERSELNDVTLNDALDHPNWQMGRKITVDCATMVNKGLEVMEAHHLFGFPYKNIKTIIHKESIIHSMVEFTDNSVSALMYNPSMLSPISYAILGETEPCGLKELDFEKLSSLTFRKMDYERYPMIAKAYEVGKEGGFMPTIYNASNEIAVELFLNNKIKFLDIEEIIIEAINNKEKYLNELKNTMFNIDNILLLDKIVKEDIRSRY